MHELHSIYAAEFKKRGFDIWGEETTGDELDKRFTPSLAPAFLWVTISKLQITFAYDERMVLWAAEGTIDLSDLGFTQLEFSDDETPRVLH